MVYSISSVLAVAKKHSFYDQNVTYPPDVDVVEDIVKQSEANVHLDELNSWPLLYKKSLYTTVERLVNDTSPQNTYRHSVYASITGGGYGSKPLFFATDVHENRRQRVEYGKLLASSGILSRADWVVTVHAAGSLYRALDLTLEIVECAGACALAAGNYMPVPDVLQLLIQYQANVIAGDSSQIVNLVNHLSELPQEEREKIRLDKILYTSEVLTAAQRLHIRATLGEGVKICSLLASAETGPWAVSNPDLTGDRTTTSSDFVYDMRTMFVEVFPDAAALEPEDGAPATHQPLPDGETGILVLTSLARLRNPLVRYICGDVGSLHALSQTALQRIPEADRPYMRVLRLEGRDRRFSFDWEGEYIEYANLAAIVEQPDYGILQWQAIVQNKPDKQEGLRPSLELRMLPSATARVNAAALHKEMVDRIKVLIAVAPWNEDRFIPVFLESLDGFEKSKTGGKVIKFIDRVS